MRESNIRGSLFASGFFLGMLICLIIHSCTVDYGVEDAKSDVKIFNETFGTNYTYQDWMFYEWEIKQEHNPYKYIGDK